MDEATLQKDLNSLLRVRNRLVHTSDVALPKVLTKLLPRLMERMERTHNQLTAPGSSTEAQQVLLNKTQDQLRQIVMHSLERIRGGFDTLPPGAPWVPTLLSFLQSSEKDALQSPLAVTLVLLILQHSMPRYLAEENEYPPDHPSEISIALPPLLHFVHQLHYKIAALKESDVPKSLLLNYRTASWICYDIVALTWGLPVLMDWSHDFFDEYEWCTPTSAKEAFLERGPSRHSHNNNNPQPSYLANAGSFHLWLDLFLFWPEDTQQRRRFVRTEVDLLVENATGMTQEGTLRLNHRRNKGQGQHCWNERYLRELKLACMECVVVEPLRGITTANFTSVVNGFHVQVFRSLILCILTASTGSMHGKVAIGHVNRVGLMISAKGGKPLERKCRSQEAVRTNTLGCGDETLLLVCCLLSLVLGDQLTLKALERHPVEQKRIESILGPIANNLSTNDAYAASEGAINTEAPKPPLQRAPVPFGVAERAMDFILTKLLPAIEEKALSQHYLEGPLLPSVVDLAVQLPVSKGAVGSYWAIQLMERFHDPNSTTAVETSAVQVDRNTRDSLDATCLKIASQVLSQVAEVEAEAGIQFGEIQHPLHPHDPLPGGVPAPYGGRRDLNLMLAQHRSSQRKRQLQVADALRARTTAYRMVIDLVTKRDIVEDILTGDMGGKPCTLLEIPIVLLKCATGEEDKAMQQLVTNALEEVLSAFKGAVPRIDTDRLERLTAALLPSLLCAVCSSSTAGRLAAVRWAAHFVKAVDRDAASHICSFLSNDVDDCVSDTAKKALMTMSLVDASMETADTHQSAQILDTRCGEDLGLLRRDLNQMAESVSLFCGVFGGVALTLLSDFNFDVDAARSAFESDQARFLDRNWTLRRSQGEIMKQQGWALESVCGICYDDVTEGKLFGLPCQHRFCVPCWRSFLNCSLKDRPPWATAPLHVSCPQHSCEERVVQEDVEALAPELVQLWETTELQSFISCSKHMRFCPGRDCSAVATVPMDEKLQFAKMEVRCSKCSTTFCFACGCSVPHQPANCKDFAEWNRIFGSTQYWVKKNAKPCPGCNVPIEKNQGCSHMRCTQCGQDFCWLCLGTLRSHLEPHICNRYEPHQSAENDEERRALFFTDRYKAHEDAEVFARFELRSYEDKKEKIASKTNWFAMDENLESMLTAARTLVRARGFLKNSYVAAWAMRKDLAHRDTFENHQANLELFTEKLSQLLLIKVQQLFAENDARAVYLHFRALAFSTASVVRYMDRIMHLEVTNV